MRLEQYYCGDDHNKWGIWNDYRKEFQFGICEDTPMLAEARLMEKIGKNGMKVRFRPKPLPKDLIEKYTPKNYMPDAFNLLIDEYISKVNVCDECCASCFCTVNYLRDSREPDKYCHKNMKKYLRKLMMGEI